MPTKPRFFEWFSAKTPLGVRNGQGILRLSRVSSRAHEGETRAKSACCHRTVKLSLGFVEDGHLVCGYHGWTYRSDGVCVRIPQRGNPTVVAGAKIPH